MKLFKSLKLKLAFQKYAGKEISINENGAVNLLDRTVIDMANTAIKNGMKLEIHQLVAGGLYPEDAAYVPNRVNAYIDAENRVTSKFRIG